MSKGPKVPQPFNPMQVSGAQTASNIQTALANARLGAVNQITPYGTVNYSFSTPPPKQANTPIGGTAMLWGKPFSGASAAAGGAAAGGAQQPPRTYAQQVYDRLRAPGGPWSQTGGQGGGNY